MNRPRVIRRTSLAIGVVLALALSVISVEPAIADTSIAFTSTHFPAEPTPHISGVTRAGNVLTVDPGVWRPAGVAFSYQWLRNGHAIAGANAQTYGLTASDVGRRISVVVHGSKLGYVPTKRTSRRTAKIGRDLYVIPSDGTYRVGSQVAAGTYVTESATSFCAWKRVSSLDGSPSSIIGLDVGAGQRIATISATDVGFTTSGCGTWILLSKEPVSLSTTLPDNGVFAAGVNFTPGLWTASGPPAGGICLWATLSGFSADSSGTIAYGIPTGPVQVQIPVGAVGFEVLGCGTWTRVSD